MLIKRLLVLAAILVPTSGWAASSNLNSLTASGAIIGTQQLYCPTTAAGSDLKCTFAQVDAYIASTAASWSALQTFPTTQISIGYPVTVATVTSGGIPYFSSTTAEASSALLAANAIVLGGGAGTAPATTTTGSGVVTAVGSGVNTNGGLTTSTTSSVVVGAINTGGGSGTAPIGLADVATGSYLQSGGTTTIPAWQAFGTGAQSAVNANVNTNGGIGTATTTSIVVGALNTGGGSGTGPVGLADVATGSYLKSGGTTTIPAWQAFGTGAQTGVATNINTNGGFPTASTTSIVQGAINVGGGSATALAGIADVATGSYLQSGGVTTNPSYQAFGTGAQTGINAAVNSTTSGSLATTAVPLTVGTSGSISGADGYYICTGTCSITLPTPAAGYQYCIRNDSAVTSVITIAAISSVLFEKTTYNGYGTVTTGTMVSGGALGDKICLIGRDATHYLVGAYVGVWTNS